MNPGVSQEATKARHSFLNFNINRIVKAIQQENRWDDPVGLIIDISDKYGELIAKASVDAGITTSIAMEVTKKACENTNTIPTLLAVLEYDLAVKILELTAPNAKKNLSIKRKVGERFIVAISNGGNTYAVVKV